MRVALVHNPDAGGAVYSTADLARLLRAADHEVEVFSKKRADVVRAVERYPGVVVAAGGDGTVAKVAIALSERDADVPFYVLPLGTSNNIAHTLGVRGTAPALITALTAAQAAGFDVCAATAPWGTTRFVEAAGVGFLGATLAREGTLAHTLERLVRRWRGRAPKGEAEVQAAARGMARRIRRAPVRHCTVIADGRDLSGEFAAVEAMNIRAIGPRLPLAPDADPGDRLLDLVLVRPEQREPLARLIESLGRERAPVAECHRVREAEISWSPEGHADDEPWPSDGRGARSRGRDGSRVRVAVHGRVRVLLPRSR